MPRLPSSRTCIECPARVSSQSKSGRCRQCANRRMHADPAYRAKLRASLEEAAARPEVKAKRAAALATWRRTMTPADRERLREHGRRQARDHLCRPEVRARSHTREARAQAIAAYLDRRFSWCPPERRDEYRQLIRSKGCTSAEARRIIEAEIFGTREHAQRELANVDLQQRLRRERDQRDAY